MLNLRTLRPRVAAVCSLLLLALLASSVVTPTSAQAREPVEASEVAPGDLVDLQYLDLLGRPSDAAGHQFWSAKLSGGTSVDSVIESMLGSREVGGAYEPAIRLYRAAFLRPPDYDGLGYWVRQSRSGVSFDRIALAFAEAPEFNRRYGDLGDEAYVEQIYRNVLGRPSDAEGMAHWQRELAEGMTRGTMLLSFSESAENVKHTSVAARMSLLTATMLRRIATPEEIEAWDQEPTDTPTGELVSRMLAAPEYEARLASLFPERHPLTGEAVSSVQDRPALALKIDNVDQARPQVGLNQADIVYEEMVEGNLTRLIAVFHSQTPSTAGPVRSVRVSDFDVLAQFNRPLLGASGANPGVLAALANAPVTNVNALVANNYWRDSSRRIPHNLMADPAGLWQSAPAGSQAPPKIFHTGRTASAAPESGGIDIEFGRASIGWRWDSEASVWRRSQNGTAHVDANGIAVGPENVVVLVTNYTPNAIDANSPEAHTVGRHRALIFGEGTVFDGFWERERAEDPIRLVTSGGSEIRLRAGRTWVELAPPLSLALVPPGVS